jgi:diguanylate cyclase (GGDEF)-like protein
VRDENGNVVALVSADLAPTATDTRMGGLTSDVTKSFASLLHSAATYASRAEFDAVTDGLTGLYGHRYLHERLDEEIERAATQDRSLALLVCDLDQFKEFNERHGHSAGDKVLRRVAHVVESCLRGTDLAARYGGEEFAAVLIDTDLTGALDVAERIRLGVRALREDTNGETITMSIGVAACPADATSREQLVDKADWATDLAKRRGRDQVVAFADQRKARRAARQGDYASAMARFAAAQQRLQEAQTLALEHLAVAMARELGLTPAEVKRVATMARRGVTGKAPAPSRGNGHNLAPRIVAVATAYHELATTSSSPTGRRQKESLKQLRRRGEEFEPDLVAGLERVLAQKS